MTKITIDRAIVEQALEALESLQGGCTDSDDGTVEAVTVWCPEVISALRSALAEPVQDWDEIEALRESLREHMAEIHRLRAALADHSGDATEMVTTDLESRPIEPVQEQDPDDEPTYCPTCGVEDGGTTCGMPNCGLRCGAEHAEPVAWMDIDSEGNRLSVRQWSDGNSQEVPLYTAPQRKPLTDEAHVLRSLLGASLGALRYHTEQTRPIQRTKETIAAIEHALTTHNIKVNTLSNHMVRPADQPSQRKPLTDEEIHDCFQQSGKTKAETRRRITRAIERAHGIGASNE